MPRVIHARDVAAVLTDGGFDPSEPDGDRDPGYRTVQDGRRLVLVFHDGPGEGHHLDLYRGELQAAGFHVVPDRQAGGRRLRVTRA